MTTVGKGLCWLTALATASMTLTACGSQQPVRAAADAAPASALGARQQTDAVTRPRAHVGVPMGAAAVSPAVDVTPPPPFALVVSDGSDLVRVAGRVVRFPGPVTDATVSPNGMALAFVDGDGNIALAHLDGTGVRVLTSTDPGVRRAQPTFEDGGSEIIFSERGHDGVWRLKEVAADGHDDLGAGRPEPAVAETADDGGHDTAPSATWFQAAHDETARSVLVFEHRTPGGTTKIYLADRNQRGFGSSPLLPGRAPSVSPTGDRVAFIGPSGQIRVLTLAAGRGSTQVTWGARPTGHLAWTPDGRQIMFATPHDVESVSSLVLRPGHNPVRVVVPRPAVVSTATSARPTVGTYEGTDPVSAALAVSRARFVDGTDLPVGEADDLGIARADHVTLVSTADPAAAAPAAAIAAGGPVLFLPDGRLVPEVRDEIIRLLQHPRGFHLPAHVDIVGTERDVPVAVDHALRGLTGLRVHVRRFSPSTAASDAAGAARGPSTTYVVVSSGDLPAIASSVSAGYPILLTDGSTLPATTATKLAHMPHDLDQPPTVYAVGSDAQEAVRSSSAGTRTFQVVDVGGGSDDYSDSLAVVGELYDAPGRLSVTTAADWRDLLIATMAGPALVVDARQGPSTAARDALAAGEAVLRSVYVVGGPRSLPRAIGRAVYGDRFVLRREPADITD
jgi:hypothetical protein